MSRTSTNIVLGLGLAGLIVEAIVSHPALAVDKVKLFTVTTPKDQIVIGLTKEEVDALPGKDAAGVIKVLGERGSMQVWQYSERRGISGEQEQAPVAVQIAEPAAKQQESARGQQVRVHHPGQRAFGEVQAFADRRQRDIHDRHIEHDHQHAQAQHGQREPAFALMSSLRGVCCD